jgi:hypothetical protein
VKIAKSACEKFCSIREESFPSGQPAACRWPETRIAELKKSEENSDLKNSPWKFSNLAQNPQIVPKRSELSGNSVNADLSLTLS